MRSIAPALIFALILPVPQPTAIVSPPAHEVTLRLEAMGTIPAVVHLTSPDSALRVVADSASSASRQLTVSTPALVTVSAAAAEVRVTTERNVAVRISFEGGASARERALHAWGREVLFRRSSDGDLLPQSQALQLVPAR